MSQHHKLCDAAYLLTASLPPHTQRYYPHHYSEKGLGDDAKSERQKHTHSFRKTLSGLGLASPADDAHCPYLLHAPPRVTIGRPPNGRSKRNQKPRPQVCAALYTKRRGREVPFVGVIITQGRFPFRLEYVSAPTLRL